MKKIALAALGAACVLGLSAAARAQGQNPEGVNPEHYLCYRIIGEVRPIPVKLKDQFQGIGARLMRPAFLCNPVQKNEQGIKDEKTHLVCYQLATQKPVNKQVKVQNQFGPQTFRVNDPQILCVPSLKEVIK